MQISERTLSILKNFRGLRNSMNFIEGDYIVTKDQNGRVMAKAKVDETFPISFSVFDLGRLIALLSMNKNPEVTFESTFLKIVGGGAKIKFAYAGDGVVSPAKVLTPETETVHASFLLSEETVDSIFKSASILGAKNLSFVSEGGKVEVVVHDIDNPSSDEYRMVLGDSESNFNVDFDISTLKFIPSEYMVTIETGSVGGRSANYARFVGRDVEYLAAMNTTSNI